MRWLRGAATLLDHMARDAIFDADTVVEAALLSVAADALPDPHGIRYADGRLHIPFQEVGQPIPLSSLPWELTQTFAPRTFRGTIDFGDISCGVAVALDRSLTLYEIEGIRLEPLLAGRRVLTVAVNGIPTSVVYEEAEYPHRVKTARIEAKSALEICLQIEVEPPFAGESPQPGRRCFRPFDPYIEAARVAFSARARRLADEAAGAFRAAVFPMTWIAHRLFDS